MVNFHVSREIYLMIRGLQTLFFCRARTIRKSSEDWESPVKIKTNREPGIMFYWELNTKKKKKNPSDSPTTTVMIRLS